METRNCKRCEKEFLANNATKIYCCYDCKKKSYIARARKDKPRQSSEYLSGKRLGRIRRSKLLSDFGGKCCRCGYDKNASALHFHHIDPSDKDYNICVDNCRTRKLEALTKEAAKCIIVCANCHTEIHHETGDTWKTDLLLIQFNMVERFGTGSL